jgi:NitT/TauT family transport system substrate-binding protein
MISVNKRIASAGAVFVALALVTAACSSDDDASSNSTTAPTTASTTGSTTESTTGSTTESTTGSTTESTTGTSEAPAAGEISAERCKENKAAGTITYLSSFDFAATPSIVDIVVAKDKGYFEALCLDVELRPSFSTSNYPLVAANQAQFSSAGSYTEILNYSKDGAEFVALVDYGKVPVEALVTPDGGATTLADLQGKTIGVKGDIPPSIVAMLAKAGLVRGEDYQEVLLDGFDPIAQLSSGIDALPVYKSNEPGQLDAAGVKYTIFDPATEGIPGSFGLIYTSKAFAEDHPTATEDFVRAALKGMEDTIADPAAAVATSVKEIDAAGNQNFLTEAGESYRLGEELQLVLDGTPDGDPIGLIDPAVFDAEYAAYVAAGVWPDGAPDDGKYYDDALAAGLYGDDGKVIWPG